MSQSPQYVLVERTNAVATVTINRPDKMNALNTEVVAELDAAFASLAAGDEPVRAAILTGAGKAFVAGADIAEMMSMTPVQAKAFADGGHRLMARIESLPYPVIAAVNGFALGGGLELALACDFIVAAAEAKMGQPEVSLAVIPGFGGTVRLARRVGIGKARELIYTGDMVNAEQALSLGLANSVVPGAELLLRVRDIALKIASKGPLAVAAAKRVLQKSQDVSPDVACEMEAQAFAGLFGSEDQRGGMQAFVNKAKATFTGR